MGILRRVNQTETDFRTLWDRDFINYLGQIRQRNIDGAYYGVSYIIDKDDINVADYLAGMAVRDVSTVPEGLVVRYVPAARYAVFEFDFQDMNDAIEYALEKWLPASPYERDQSVNISDFLVFDLQKPVAFYLPVRECHAL